jgi:hypothetical protein
MPSGGTLPDIIWLYIYMGIRLVKYVIYYIIHFMTHTVIITSAITGFY